MVAIPDASPGLVIRYAYLWKREADRCRTEGSKDRPGVVVLAVTNGKGGGETVWVAPITHTRPNDPEEAIEIPMRTGLRLGLDEDQSWIVISEVNRFTCRDRTFGPSSPDGGHTGCYPQACSGPFASIWQTWPADARLLKFAAVRDTGPSMTPSFKGNFTQQPPIPEEAIERAVAVMRSGRLHRYNVADGEVPETVRLENEFAAWMGARFCLACTSGGYALQTALRAFGVSAGEPVLTNGFTLSPVPGAIAAAGGRAVLVEITDDLVIDLDDLGRKAQSSAARVLMLSHMRGHIADMDALMDTADGLGIAVIEDCAHTMGARWGDTKSGTHGIAACFSTQTYKHLNSGEGGFITSDDEALMARATILSGSYMLYGRHDAVPADEVFDRVRLETPNCSGRMDNLRAAILRPQLAALDRLIDAWNARYRAIEEILESAPGVRLPARPAREHHVGSSIQFLTPDLDEARIRTLVKACLARGVELKWFGDAEPLAYTSRYDSWRYLERQSLPATDRILASLLDMRIPLTFSVEDCRLIGRIIAECMAAVRGGMSK